MAEIPYLRIVCSRGSDILGDCGICCLGTICNRTFEDVVIEADKIAPHWRHGLYLTHMIKIAAVFGYELKRRRKYDVETAVGILSTEVDQKGGTEREGHVVVLNAGQIIDSDATLWTPDAFQLNFRAKFFTLLEVQ